MNLKGETKAFGSFTYDSVGRKLRFSSNESHPADTSLDLDLLMLFDEVAHKFHPFPLQRNVTLRWFHDLTSEYVFAFNRGFSMRLTSKTIAVRRKSFKCPCILLTFLMTPSFTVQWPLGVPPLKARGWKSISGLDHWQIWKVG